MNALAPAALRASLPARLPPALPAPYAGPAAPLGPDATPELDRLVEAQVQALLTAAPAAAELAPDRREALAGHISHVARHVAALALDDWRLSESLGQRPLVATRETLRPIDEPRPAPGLRGQSLATRRPALARTQADFRGDATDRVGAVTRSTLRAISFPSFVADLIKGTFNAILDATQTQMGAFTELLEAVSKTVDQFESENVSNAQAEQWLAQAYPQHIRMEAGQDGPRAVPAGAEGAPDGLRSALNLPDEVDQIDETNLEEVLIPAARRKLAQSRLQMLSTMVMMGLQRIVINHGRIRATMGFHIDATDSAREERADMVDAHVGIQGQVGFGWWSASAQTSITYVRSTKADSNAELNVNADLTGEVDLTFSTDYLPLNRMATTERIAAIRNNTPNPAENAPSAAATGGGAAPGTGPSAAQIVADRAKERRDAQLPPLPQLTQPGGPGTPHRQGATAPGATAPGATAPGSTAPGSTAPGSTPPSSTTPGSTPPGSTAPGSTPPSSTTPGNTQQGASGGVRVQSRGVTA